MTMHPEDARMTRLYAINDAIRELAATAGVTESSFDSEEAFDEWLNDATHTLADAIEKVRTENGAKL